LLYIDLKFLIKSHYYINNQLLIESYY